MQLTRAAIDARFARISLDALAAERARYAYNGIALTLKQLYIEQRDAPFDTAWDAITVEGIDLRILQEGAAGPLYQFFEGGGRVGVWQTAILGLCCHDLAVVVRGLDDREARAYFARLEALARRVLEAIRDRSA